MKQRETGLWQPGPKKSPFPGRVSRTVRASLSAGLAVFLLSVLPAQASERCHKEAVDYLDDLPLADGEVKSLRLMERTNISDDFGPDIFGVDAWVRLNSCSGYLVINMTRGCFVKQAYTRGDCSVQGLSNY